MFIVVINFAFYYVYKFSLTLLYYGMITRGKTRNMDTVLNTLNEIKEDLKGKATQAQVNNLLVEIHAKDLRIKQFADRLAFMESIVQKLEIKYDDNEQYYRRVDLRLNNIPLPTNGVIESSQDCSTKGKNYISWKKLCHYAKT